VNIDYILLSATIYSLVVLRFTKYTRLEGFTISVINGIDN